MAEILPGKKRIMLTLTQATFEQLQAYVRDLGLPKSTVSVVIDGAIEQLLPVFETALRAKHEGRQLNFADLLSVTGKMMSDAAEEMKQ
jgi:hypothetical protein